MSHHNKALNWTPKGAGQFRRFGLKVCYPTPVRLTQGRLWRPGEKKKSQQFWKYIEPLPKDDYAVYYYSSHEKTTYKKLQKRYPGAISMENVEHFFASPNVIDLYSLTQRQTDWPVGSYSIKSLATYLGFKWRDETPSGALSIQWFNNYLENNDKNILKRILEYNEDDCKALMILKDKLVEISNN